jgi:hypothetical protein
MIRGKKGESVAITFRVHPKVRVKVVEEADRLKRSHSDLGKFYLGWIQDNSASAGSWEDFQRLVSVAQTAGSPEELKRLISAAKSVGSSEELLRVLSAAEILKPMADKEDRTLADMLRLATKWLAEEYKRAGTWEKLKRQRARAAGNET